MLLIDTDFHENIEKETLCQRVKSNNTNIF